MPKKVLKTIDYVRKRTILEEVIRRVKLSKKIDKIVIATTKNKSDDDIVNISQKEGIGWFRGSENDVLSRYFFAAKENRFDHIVRITSDCPFIDPYVCLLYTSYVFIMVKLLMKMLPIHIRCLFRSF